MTRGYLPAVIDNFSRRILAWKASSTFDPSITAELLLSAASGVVDAKPILLVDGRKSVAKAVADPEHSPAATGGGVTAGVMIRGSLGIQLVPRPTY